MKNINKKELLKTIKLLEIFESNPKLQLFLNNLDFFEQVCKFILSQENLSVYNFKDLEYKSINESFVVAKDFLGTLTTDYPSILEQYISNGIINIYDKSKEKMGSGNVSTNENNKLCINLGVHNDVNDIYLIVHEFMHSINEKKVKTEDREILTEVFAIFSEYLVLEYLNQRNINANDNNEMQKLRLYTFYKRCEKLIKYIEIIRYIKSNPTVKQSLKEEIDKTYINSLDEMELLSSIQYSFGNAASIILLDKIQNKSFTIEEYIKYNKDIMDSKNNTIYSKLFQGGLNINEFISGFEYLIKLMNKEKSMNV